MADNQNYEQEKDHPPKRGLYLGKPENKKNPNSVQVRIGNQAPQNKGKGHSKSKNLPPPKNKTASTSKDVNSSAPMADAIFARETSLFEISPRTTFTPLFNGSNEVSRTTFEIYSSHSNDTSKSLTVGMLSYYQSCLLWLRIIQLKKASNSQVSVIEQRIFDQLSSISFSTPNPISLIIKNVGHITTPVLQNLYPTFPEFPSHNQRSSVDPYGLRLSL